LILDGGYKEQWIIEGKKAVKWNKRAATAAVPGAGATGNADATVYYFE
jgi:hypothetical protein